jgi:branched-chain amino acid transport system ATP-binding protein
MALLEGVKLTKKFGGLVAINELSFKIEEDDILGLIGPNGAGKTTLFNLVSGLIKPDSGTLIFKNDDITKNKPHEICKKGIARTHQLVKPFLNQTVLQNALVGRFFGRYGSVSTEQATKDVEPLIKLLNLDGKTDQFVRDLNILDTKNVEIVRALATKPDLLLLDEPASGLSPTEMSHFMETIRTINKMGVTVCIIEHVMRLVIGLCNRIIVIHHGERVTEGNPVQVMNDIEVIKVYLGEAI